MLFVALQNQYAFATTSHIKLTYVTIWFLCILPPLSFKLVASSHVHLHKSPTTVVAWSPPTCWYAIRARFISFADLPRLTTTWSIKVLHTIVLFFSCSWMVYLTKLSQSENGYLLITVFCWKPLCTFILEKNPKSVSPVVWLQSSDKKVNRIG